MKRLNIRKRKINRPDTRPRWDQPIEEFKTWWAGRWVDAKEWSKLAEQSLGGQKHYKNDPTYDLKRKK